MLRQRQESSAPAFVVFNKGEKMKKTKIFLCSLFCVSLLLMNGCSPGGEEKKEEGGGEFIIWGETEK